jgi:hypothetical protein
MIFVPSVLGTYAVSVSLKLSTLSAAGSGAMCVLFVALVLFKVVGLLVQPAIDAAKIASAIIITNFLGISNTLVNKIAI